MKTKLLSVLLLLLISYVNLRGQDINNPNTTEKKSFKNAFGIGVGFTTGCGLSYRYIPRKMGFQVNFAPYFTDYGNNAIVSAGLTLLNKIIEANYCNLYLYLSNSYLYTKNQNYYYGNSGPDFNEQEKWNTGFGLGFEFDTRKRVVLNIMGGWAQYNSFEKVLPTGELALYYRF